MKRRSVKTSKQPRQPTTITPHSNGVKMTDNGSASVFGPAYAQLDRKIDIIERDFRADIAATNTKIDGVGAKIDGVRDSIFERLDRREGIATLSRSSNGYGNGYSNGKTDNNPYTLIVTAVGICTLLGSAGAYVSSNLQTQAAANFTATKDAMLVVSDTLKKETTDRQEADRRIYEAIKDDMSKVWSKDAHLEFEKRIDQADLFRHEYYIAAIARLEKEHDYMIANMVPRAEHEQKWATQQSDLTRIEKQAAERSDSISLRLNAAQLSSDTKLAEVERVIHGYGIADEVKSIQDKLQSLTDKIFGIITAFVPKPGSPAGTDK